MVSFRSPVSLRRVLGLRFGLAALAVWLSLSFSLWLFLYLSEVGAWRVRLGELAQNGAESAAGLVERVNQTLRLVGQIPAEELRSHPEVLSRALEGSPVLLELVRFDSTGKSVAAAHTDRPLISGLFTTPQSNWFRRAAAGEPYWGSLPLTPTGIPHLFYAVPTIERGVAVARLETESLLQALSRVQVGRAGQVWVANRSGEILAHKNRKLVLSGVNLLDRDGLHELTQAAVTRVLEGYTDLYGNAVMGAAAPVVGTDWVVIAELPRAEILESSRSALWALGVGLPVLIALLLFFSMRVLEQRVWGPLETLRAGAERIVAGELHHRIPAEEPDDIGRVAEALNKLAERLQARESQLQRQASELQSLNAEMEARVQARTVDLARLHSELELEMAGRREGAPEPAFGPEAQAAQPPRYGLWDWDLASRTVYFSPRWKAILGYQDDELQNRLHEWISRVHPEDLPALRADLRAHLEGQTSSFENRHRLRHANGSYLFVLARGLAVRDAEGRPVRLAGSLTDVTPRGGPSERADAEPGREPLTGLATRTQLLERIQSALEKSQRNPKHTAAVLCLDLDGFQSLNESLGRMVGDALLVQVARRLESGLRPADLMARLGGDDFAFLLDDLHSPRDAELAAARLLERLQSPIQINGHSVEVSACIGVALTRWEDGTQPYSEAQALLRDAEMALARAKALGRGQIQVFEPRRQKRAAALVEREAELRRGLERRELVLHYQPIISLSTSTLIGVEALVRWRHPQHGLVGPREFLPLAEESGLIVPLGEWILDTACAQARVWQTGARAPVAVAVNLSARQFDDETLLSTVRRALDETGLPPRQLELEVAEAVVLRDVERSRRVLNALHELGVQLALDNFGSSHVGLGEVRQFPFHVLKLDRSFLFELEKEQDSQVLLSAMISMAHSLQLRVVAEGVETQRQLDLLRVQHCDAVQGFVYSHPLSAETIGRLLRSQARWTPGEPAFQAEPL